MRIRSVDGKAKCENGDVAIQMELLFTRQPSIVVSSMSVYEVGMVRGASFQASMTMIAGTIIRAML